MYLSSLFRYVSSSPSRALTYPFDQALFSDFCLMLSSSFSASVQARTSMLWKNLVTDSWGMEPASFIDDVLPRPLLTRPVCLSP